MLLQVLSGPDELGELFLWCVGWGGPAAKFPGSQRDGPQCDGLLRLVLEQKVSETRFPNSWSNESRYRWCLGRNTGRTARAPSLQIPRSASTTCTSVNSVLVAFNSNFYLSDTLICLILSSVDMKKSVWKLLGHPYLSPKFFVFGIFSHGRLSFVVRYKHFSHVRFRVSAIKVCSICVCQSVATPKWQKATHIVSDHWRCP